MLLDRINKKRVHRGFTLVEMVVATVLLVGGVVAALSAISIATQATGMSEKLQTAALIAQRRMTEIEIQPDTLASGDQQGAYEEEYPGYRWQQKVETTEYENLFRVTVTVQWGEPASPHSRSLVTYLRKEDKQKQQQNQQNQQQQQNSGDSNGGGGNGNGQ